MFRDIWVDAGQCQLLIRRCIYWLNNQLSVAIWRLLILARCWWSSKFLWNVMWLLCRRKMVNLSEAYLIETVTAIIMLWIDVMIVVSRAGGTRIRCRHCTRWRWKWTLDILECRFLFGNRYLEGTIDGVCILNRCRFTRRRTIMFSILIDQILKLYPNICTWKTQRATEW